MRVSAVERFIETLAGAIDPEAAALAAGIEAPWVPTTDDELHRWLIEFFGIMIPRIAVCRGHCAPFQALADAYFARHSRTVWKASRGFGGKTIMLAALSLVEAITLKALVNLLGGSGQQSERVHKYMQGGDTMAGRFWAHPQAPTQLLLTDPTRRETRLVGGGGINALMASATSIRGPHPQRLRGDEIDEMDAELWDAAQGQPMEALGVREQVVGSSTHHHADGTMTRELRVAAEKGWPVYEWSLPGDALVADAAGVPRPVVDYGVGDRVLGAEGRAVAVSATPRHLNLEAALVSVRVAGLPDPLVCTPAHRILTPTGWRRAGELAVGDELYEPASPLEPGGAYDDGWLVGLYVAEGWRVGTRAVCFAVHEREAPAIAARLGAWGVTPRTHATSPPSHGRRIEVHGMRLRALVDAWVAGGSSQSKALRRLPTARAFAAGLLDGWLAGDGWTARRARVGQTASVALACQMLRVGGSLGFACALSRNLNRPGPAGRERGTPGAPFWRLSVAGFSSPLRHVNRARAVEAARQRAAGATVSVLAREFGVKRDTVRRWLRGPAAHHHHQPRPDTGGVWRRVLGVTRRAHAGVVYDLTVPDGQAFIAAGVLVHNCWKETTAQPFGFITLDQVARKRSVVTDVQWQTEYDLQEPSVENVAIDADSVERAFSPAIGTHTGQLGQVIELEAPDPEGEYAVGADWGKLRDKTIIWVNRTDVRPVRLVAFAHLAKMPYPTMVERFERWVKHYKGQREQARAAYDHGGPGVVLEDYLTVKATPIDLVGITRSELFRNWIVVIESGQFLAPRVTYAYREHRYCTQGDLAGVGHPPDSFIAAALAWLAGTQMDDPRTIPWFPGMKEAKR